MAAKYFLDKYDKTLRDIKNENESLKKELETLRKAKVILNNAYYDLENKYDDLKKENDSLVDSHDGWKDSYNELSNMIDNYLDKNKSNETKLKRKCDNESIHILANYTKRAKNDIVIQNTLSNKVDTISDVSDISEDETN